MIQRLTKLQRQANNGSSSRHEEEANIMKEVITTESPVTQEALVECTDITTHLFIQP